jgi:hypothetical protein
VQIYGQRLLKDVSCKETCFYLLNNDCGNVAGRKDKKQLLVSGTNRFRCNNF